jgi:hypothetical protein
MKPSNPGAPVTGVFSRRRGVGRLPFSEALPVVLRTSASSTTPRAAAARSFYRQTPQRSWPACALSGTKRGPWAAGARRPAGRGAARRGHRHERAAGNRSPYLFVPAGARHGCQARHRVRRGGRRVSGNHHYRAEAPIPTAGVRTAYASSEASGRTWAAAILPSTRWPGGLSLEDPFGGASDLQ